MLQLALDVASTAEAVRLAGSIYPYFDIAEIGTPLIIEEGLAPLAVLKARYPDKKYLADTKIVDAGYFEAASAFKRGADIVTVLGVADNATIQGALRAAVEHGGRIMVDLMYVSDKVGRARQLASLGVHILCLHTAHDLQQTGIDPMADLKNVRAAINCVLAIAGGIKLDDVPRAIKLGADIFVVGSGITGAKDQRDTARCFMERMGEQG